MMSQKLLFFVILFLNFFFSFRTACAWFCECVKTFSYYTYFSNAYLIEIVQCLTTRYTLKRIQRERKQKKHLKQMNGMMWPLLCCDQLPLECEWDCSVSSWKATSKWFEHQIIIKIFDTDSWPLYSRPRSIAWLNDEEEERRRVKTHRRNRELFDFNYNNIGRWASFKQ